MSGQRPGTLAGELPVSELKQQFNLFDVGQLHSIMAFLGDGGAM